LIALKELDLMRSIDLNSQLPLQTFKKDLEKSDRVINC
jgi:hypothetical protein